MEKKRYKVTETAIYDFLYDNGKKSDIYLFYLLDRCLPANILCPRVVNTTAGPPLSPLQVLTC